VRHSWRSAQRLKGPKPGAISQRLPETRRSKESSAARLSLPGLAASGEKIIRIMPTSSGESQPQLSAKQGQIRNFCEKSA